MALTEKEKQATIALLEAKIEKATGKKVTYVKEELTIATEGAESDAEAWWDFALDRDSKKQIVGNNANVDKAYKEQSEEVQKLIDSDYNRRVTMTSIQNESKVSKIKAIHEKLEALTGKKVVFAEGTWALPKMPQDAQKVQEAIAELEAFKKKYYFILGDDEMLDGIDNAIKRIKELANYAMNQHTKG